MSLCQYTFWGGGQSYSTVSDACWHTPVTQLSHQCSAALLSRQETQGTAGLRGCPAAQAGVVSPDLKQGSLHCTRGKGWLHPQFLSALFLGWFWFFSFLFFFFLFLLFSFFKGLTLNSVQAGFIVQGKDRPNLGVLAANSTVENSG